METYDESSDYGQSDDYGGSSDYGQSSDYGESSDYGQSTDYGESTDPGNTDQQITADYGGSGGTGDFAAVTLSAIECFVPDDLAGDEVYITANGQTVWGPVAMNTNDFKAINQEIAFSSDPLVIQVFDQETWPLSDDEIGTVSIPRPATEDEIRRAPDSADLTTHGAYRLHFSVHRV